MNRVAAICALLILLGCGFGGSSAVELDSQTALARQFGEAARDGNWQAALALTSRDYQSRNTAKSLRKGYDELIGLLQKDDPNFRSNAVETFPGDLPTSEKEAADDYRIANPPPKKVWRALIYVDVGYKPSGGKEVVDGANAQLLLVEEASGLKIGHVYWDFMN